MKRLVVGEHSRIARTAQAGAPPAGGGAALDGHLYDRLRRFDCEGRPSADRVFDWRDGHTRTAQWVGVVQVPGVQVEILPKVDASEGAADWGTPARANLLYMLSVSGDIPVRSREVARLVTRKAPLSETLAKIFAERLQEELLRGPERGYQQREENLRSFKGKLLISAQSRSNAAHRERFFCRFEEFSDDTAMNRIFRAACRALLVLTQAPATQDVLRRCLLLLDGASDVEVQDADFNAIAINRQNQRFEEVLRFCRLILGGRTPTIQAGGTRSFSLLFDMNKVFERFVAALLCRYVAPRIEGIHIHPQAVKHRRHLMECEGSGVLGLEPDILIEGHGRHLVIDTKWKVLSAVKRGRGGVADSDLYQLYAYTRRYESQRSILLYPDLPGLEARNFDVLDGKGERSGEQIAIRQLRLHRDLTTREEHEKIVGELEALVREGLGLGPAVAEADQGHAA
ncbi:MAG: McrC family protein [Minicystis sp.]